MGQLSAVIKALGVEKVVWIDDMFASISQNVTPDLVELATKISNENLFVPLGRPDLAEEDDKVARLIEAFENDTELVTRAVELSGQGTSLDRDKAREMMNRMDCVAEEKTGADWQGVLGGTFPPYENTLFLMDRDFKDEGIDADQSNDLLKKTVANYLIKSKSNYCVVLTKEVAEEAEADSRSELLAQLLGGDPPKQEELIRFSVISKNAVAGDEEGALSKSLRGKLAGVVLFSMLKKIEQSLTKSVDSLRNVFASEFPDVNKAVLHNSYEEGASELDVLLRILQQKQRLELARSFQKDDKEDGLRQILGRFRLFQLDVEEEDETRRHTVSGELERICRAEVLTDGRLINEMMLPVVPGDVFLHTTPGAKTVAGMKRWRGELEIGKRYLMLLGQLCDVIPRDHGKTATNMAFLSEFEVKAAKNHDKGLEKNQIHSGRKGWMVIGDIALHFDFRNVFAANVPALQLCSFNKYGAAYLSKKESSDDVWSLASVMRAKKNVLNLLGKGKPIPSELQYYAVNFTDGDKKRSIKIEKKGRATTFSYSLRRVCRVRDIEASEALGALERYWRRAAKPHYFAN
jgi:hypothetical protein